MGSVYINFDKKNTRKTFLKGNRYYWPKMIELISNTIKYKSNQIEHN